MIDDENYYKAEAERFSEFANYLNSVLTVYGNVHNPIALRARGSAINGAHEGYNQIKRLAAKNGVDIGTRENFKEVLELQIKEVLDTEPVTSLKNAYIEYMKGIMEFLEFYYSRF